MEEIPLVKSDVLVIGGGIAGIRAAIEAHDCGSNVVLANKGAFGQDGASTWMAGSGYTVALYPPDSVDAHFKDTIVGGKHLNNQKLVYEMLSITPRATIELAKWGVRFKKDAQGKFERWTMPGHTYVRSLYLKYRGMAGGPEFKQVFTRQVRRRKGLSVMEDLLITDLLTRGNTVVGALGLDIRAGQFVVLSAKSVVLATGGAMQCYKLTTAGTSCTGDGYAMAYRCGVKMMDMEFMQFLPAVAIWPPNVYGDRTPYAMLVNLRGMFLNNRGERFMERYYPKEKDWVTRDALSRAIASEVRAGRGSPHGGAYLTFDRVPKDQLDAFIEDNKDSLFIINIREAGIDLRRDSVEVAPGAHFTQGGCRVNERCETNVEGLYAVGEAVGGVHGVDRLAGNALPLCLAMGIVGGKVASERIQQVDRLPVEADQVEKLKNEATAPLVRTKGTRPGEIKARIRELLDTYAMFNRSQDGLDTAIKEITNIRETGVANLSTSAKNKRFNTEWAEALEVRCMVDVAEMICRAALARKESRGCHERADYPETSPDWLKNVIVQQNSSGKMSVSTEPVVFSHLKPGEDLQ